MADVFISYAREDRPKVEEIARALEANGLSVWWDRRIAGGSEFAHDIERELAAAKAAIVCWSKASVASRWVRDEASDAAESGKLIPILLDHERAPMGFRQFQAIDLSSWSGEPGDAMALQLVDAVRGRARSAPAAAQEAPDGSIAVLPFTNLSGDATCQHFCDAVGADIISLLARNKDLKVMARGSSFAHRDSSGGVAEIGRKLNVRYVIDGTVRRSDTSARITADLVLCSTGQLLWSGQSEGKLTDVFALQDEMARHIAGVVAPELSRYEREAAARKAPDSLTAWECAQRGSWHLYKLAQSDLEKAERWFSRAIAIDPRFALGHAGLAHAYVHLVFHGSRSDRGLMIEAANKTSTEAVELDSNDAYCRAVRARAYGVAGTLDEATAEAEAAVALNPISALAYYAQGWAQSCRRETAPKALESLDRAIALAAQDPLLGSIYCMKAIACLLAEDLAAAETAARFAVRQHNATFWSFAMLAAILGLKGETVESAPVVRQLREREPNYNCATFAEDCFFIEDQAFISKVCDGLKTAGVC
jgi:TolB-like protein